MNDEILPTSPSLAFLGMIFEWSLEGLEHLPRVIEHLDLLRPEMFPEGGERTAFQGATQIALSGKMPSAALLERTVTLPQTLVTRARQAAEQYGDSDGVVEAIRNGYLKRSSLLMLSKAIAQVEEGDLEGAASLVSRFESRAGGSGMKGLTRAGYDPRRAITPRPITLSHPQLNEAVGGGLGVGGELGLSMILSGSGVGKSAWVQGEIPFWRGQGHRILYFAGESNNQRIWDEVCRIGAMLPPSVLVERYPIHLDRLAVEADRIRGQDELGLQVFDAEKFAFDGESVRATIEIQSERLERDRALGLVPPNAQLIAVVDNLDSLLEGTDYGKKQQWEVVQEEFQSFLRCTFRNSCHVMLLAQCSAEGEPEIAKGPPGGTQVASYRKAKSKLAVMLALYRPTTELLRDMTLPSGEAHPASKAWIVNHKARGGQEGTRIPVHAHKTVGCWKPLAEY